MRTRSKTSLLVIALAGLSAMPLVPASASGCAAADHPGGEWRSYGHDLSNSRTQPLETAIGADEVGSIVPGWQFDVSNLGATGEFQSTPSIADGCLYAGTDEGWIFALNADTGDLVWQRKLAGGVFGVTVTDGKVVALVNRTNEPFATALDQSDGAVLWATPVPQVRNGLRTNASTVVWQDVVFMGYSVVEGDIVGHAGWQLLDLDSGARLAHDYVIPPEDWARGYGGGGVWTTGVVDATGHVFVGTSNPTNKKHDHRQHNAILKIDLNRTLANGDPNPDLGHVVDAAKGNFDQYYPGLDRQPACEATGDRVTYIGFSVTCAQFDLDFGASPNLFDDGEGHVLVGELQKSGVYHAFYADTMELAWTQIFAAPCLQCNMSTTAVDGTNVYGIGTPPSQLVAADQHRGGYRWASIVGDGAHHQAVSTANGVVYTVDTLGFLHAFNAETGLPIVRHATIQDTGALGIALSAAGIAIARNTLYVPVADQLVTYGLPA
jgi:polyvinyl alcohol dehydrogenase (cytochrome)